MRLSVIVPVFKAEKSLHKCLDSIVSQPFKDWELILVDDGSPDLSGEICDDYAKIDERIKVIHQQNEGVSMARNHGLEIATGDYVTFIDSDDSLEGDCFSLLKNAESDLIVFESISYQEDGNRNYWYQIDEKRIDTPTDLEQFILDYINVFVLDGPCAKFFRRKVIDTLRFPEGQPLGEDNVFMLSFIRQCQNVELRKGAYYVIDDHYDNDYKKYLMPADRSRLCLENIINAYHTLNISVPSFERRMFNTFFMVIDSHSDYDSWYGSPIVKNLEKKYLCFESPNFRILYNFGKCRYTKHLGYTVYGLYPQVIKVLKSLGVIHCLKVIKRKNSYDIIQ